MLNMTKKKWMVTIAVTVALVAALGTTVAFAADEDGSLGRGARRWFNSDNAPYSAERLAELVEDGVITQEQADSILAGDTRLYDSIDHEECEDGEYGLFARGSQGMYSEEQLSGLVDDGLITQEQADLILAGDAHLFDFVDREDCEEYGEGLYGEDNPGRGMDRAPRGGRGAFQKVNP